MDPVATVPLALWDFVPVLLAGAACLALARRVSTDVPRLSLTAGAGAVLVLAGGMCRAGWKLLLAAEVADVRPLQTALFVLLCPGFVLLAWCLLHVLGRPPTPLLPGAAVGAGLVGAVALRSTAPLLTVTALAATATGALALLLAHRSGDAAAVTLFATELVVAFALVPLSHPPHTVDKQWLEESLNAVGQGAFLLGAVRLTRARAAAPARAIPHLTGSTS